MKNQTQRDNTSNAVTVTGLSGIVRIMRGQLEGSGYISKLVPFAALIGLFILYSILIGPRFLATSNLLILLQQTVVVAITGFGLTFVIVSGSIDLSSGSVIALSGMVAATTASTSGVVIGVMAGLGTGALCGVFNGFGVSTLRIPSFIVTLGMMSIARGATIVYSGSRPVSVIGSYEFLGGRPEIFVVLAVALAVSYVLFNFTTFGRYCLAIGGDERVSKLTGVKVRRQKLLVFVFAGLMSGLAGVILSARLSAATPTAADTFELTAISSVVLGGTPLTGGIGTIQGTLIGGLILAVLTNGLVILGVPSAVQLVLRGIILVLAVLVSLERAKIGVIK